MSMDKTLYIELFQPFAQYRNPFTFYYAQSYPLPPKSTIVGMLQNAVDDWYGNRYGLKKWWDNLKISVHGGFESAFWNYQQLVKGNIQISEIENRILLVNQGLPLYNDGIKSQRTPVYQQELFNGHLYIFIRGDKKILNEVKKALDFSSKILCLGRSEDIIFIKKVKFVEDVERKTVRKSIWLTYPTYIKQRYKKDEREEVFPIKNEKYPVYSIPVKVIFKNSGRPIKNKAEFTKNTKRIVEFESVIYAGHDYVVYLKREADIEKFRINDEIFKIPVEFGWL